MMPYLVFVRVLEGAVGLVHLTDAVRTLVQRVDVPGTTRRVCGFEWDVMARLASGWWSRTRSGWVDGWRVGGRGGRGRGGLASFRFALGAHLS